MDIIDKFLIGVVATLSCAILASRTFWAKEKTTRKAEFVSPVLATLERIYRLVPDEYDSITEILKADYPIHQTAYVNYINNLTFLGRYIISKKWIAYRGEYPKEEELPEEDHRYRFCHFIPRNNSDHVKKRNEVVAVINKIIS